MILYYLIKRNFKGILISLLIALTGIVIFLGTWQLYCVVTGIEFSGPMKYSSLAFIEKLLPRVFNSPLIGLGVNFARFTLWIGLYSILLWLLVCLKKIGDYRKKGSIEPVAFLICFTFLLGVGYFFTGGMSFGFPRYHYAILPAMSIVCAFVLKDIIVRISKKDFFIYGLIAIFLSLFYYFIVRDLLYIINFSLREAATTIPHQTKSVLFYFGYKFILYVVPAVAVFIIIKVYKGSSRWFEKIAVPLLIMICATNLSLDFMQARADYLVRYCYGEKGTKKLLRYLNDNTKLGEVVLAPNDIIYYLRDKKIPYLPSDFWYKLDTVREAIKLSSVKFVVYSIGHNDIKQFKEVLSHPEFISELREHFVFQGIGSYKVWRRK